MSANTTEALTYAKVNGPPDNWMWLDVLDKATGEKVDGVTEVNTAEGWLIRSRRDELGLLVFVGGNFVDERVEGDFEIVARAN